MNLTEEQINAVIDMASLFYTSKEIAINIEVDIDDFDMEIKSEQGPVYKAFMTGWFESDMKLRRSTLQSAINGSTPSIQIIENYKNKI